MVKPNTTLEQTEIVTARRRHYIYRRQCERCNLEVSMVTPAHAELLAFYDLETILAWIQKDRLHTCLVDSRHVLVCLNSLFRLTRSFCANLASNEQE